ncbi:hypothetical protein Vadar_002076 [Vaccinium darrowii]|uniref:Uncharacterized protein n=1 Tax=Vaccinium darrowii TaxID=229202 RepID=A0ACB7WXE2_9ERIC|nr:hypothetical protein Vadar_002076 [Vaccinium darrowii]
MMTFAILLRFTLVEVLVTLLCDFLRASAAMKLRNRQRAAGTDLCASSSLNDAGNLYLPNAYRRLVIPVISTIKFQILFYWNFTIASAAQNNAISDPIPSPISKLEKLQTLDLSSNNFNGEIPGSLGDLKNLNYFYGYLESLKLEVHPQNQWWVLSRSGKVST